MTDNDKTTVTPRSNRHPLLDLADSLTDADYSVCFEVGQVINLAPIFKLKGMEIPQSIVRQTIEKLSFNDPDEVIQESPFTVVYIATGAMQDIVLKTTLGQHLMMPSGILYLCGRILADNYSEAELDALCMREGIELVN